MPWPRQFSSACSSVSSTSSTSAPRAAPIAAVLSRTVSTCGPVTRYSWPPCPSSVRATAATAPMSDSWTIALSRSTNGSRTAPSLRMPGAHSRAFAMNSTGITTVHAKSLARTAVSTGVSPPPCSTVTRRTPASFARARISSAVSSGAKYAPPKVMRCSPVTPCSAGASDAGSVRSPPTTSTPAGNSARSGSRVSARTCSPRSSSCSTTRRPTVPVAPVTRIVMRISFVGSAPSERQHDQGRNSCGHLRSSISPVRQGIQADHSGGAFTRRAG